MPVEAESRWAGCTQYFPEAQIESQFHAHDGWAVTTSSIPIQTVRAFPIGLPHASFAAHSPRLVYPAHTSPPTLLRPWFATWHHPLLLSHSSPAALPRPIQPLTQTTRSLRFPNTSLPSSLYCPSPPSSNSRVCTSTEPGRAEQRYKPQTLPRVTAGGTTTIGPCVEPPRRTKHQVSQCGLPKSPTQHHTEPRSPAGRAAGVNHPQPQVETRHSSSVAGRHRAPLPPPAP
jgi:hypothetical protein